jgi:5-methyltetrahydropteroyltriglutamate--homocysteine methyltransferase
LLKGKEVLLGAIDVAGDRVETPEDVAATIEQASRFLPVEQLYPCTNCGMARPPQTRRPRRRRRPRSRAA